MEEDEVQGIEHVHEEPTPEVGILHYTCNTKVRAHISTRRKGNVWRRKKSTKERN